MRVASPCTLSVPKPPLVESVRFVQQGGTARTILTTTRATGRTRFTLAPGPGGRRTILAVLSFNGFPRKAITIAHFRAPAPTRPVVRHATYRIRHHIITLRWKPTRGAAYYSVTIQLNKAKLRYRLGRIV